MITETGGCHAVVLQAFRQYFDFSGRAQRAEFWMFMLVNLVALIALAVLDNLLGLTPPGRLTNGVLSSVYSLAVAAPSLAVGARRLHDIGRSGWWQLLSVIPIIGPIVLIVWWATPGKPEPNRWGGNPKFAPAPDHAG